MNAATHKITFNAHSSNLPFALAIKWRTSSSYNHISIDMDGVIYEAKFLKGFIKGYGGHKDIVKKVSLLVTGEVYYTYLEYLETSVGRSYDFTSALGFFLNKKMQNDNDLFCSEPANKLFYLIIKNYKEPARKLISPEVFIHRLEFYKYGFENVETSEN